MDWTIFTSIAAAISAIFAAISAWLSYFQNKLRYKIKLFNNLFDKKPQNVFYKDSNFALVRLAIYNLSNRILNITDCSIMIEKKSYVALDIDTDFKLPNLIKLTTEYGAQKTLYDKQNDNLIKLPVEIKPFGYIDSFILFPAFQVENVSIIISHSSVICSKCKRTNQAH